MEEEAKPSSSQVPSSHWGIGSAANDLPISCPITFEVTLTFPVQVEEGEGEE